MAAAGGAVAPPATARSGAAPTAGLEPAAAAAVCRAVAALYDPLHGGLGAEPKFPQPDALGLLLAAAVRQGDERLLAMALHSLDAMAAGELHDAVEQGFFRYATRRDWSAPHYEKLLDDNARLALLYLDAFAFTGRAAYAEVAAGVIDYLTTVLRAPDAPVFFGSQDADEHYYSYDAAGRGRVAVKPAIDRTVFVDANALAARALLRAATLLDRSDLLETALAATDDLWDRGHGRHAMVHYLGGPIDGLLADQAQMTAALLDAYEVSGDRTYLARARLLADWALERLRARDGRFTDRPQVTGTAPAQPARRAAGGARGRRRDGRRSDPSRRLQRRAGPTVRRRPGRSPPTRTPPPRPASWPPRGRSPSCASPSTPTHIVVVGGRGDAQAGALLRAGLRIAEPLRSVQLLDPDADAETIVREGYSVEAGRRGGLRLPRRRLPGAHLGPRPPARAGRPLGTGLKLRVHRDVPGERRGATRVSTAPAPDQRREAA